MRIEDWGEGVSLTPAQEKALTGQPLTVEELLEVLKLIAARLVDPSTPPEALPALKAEWSKRGDEIRVLDSQMTTDQKARLELIRTSYIHGTIIELTKAPPWPFDVFFHALEDFGRVLEDTLQAIWRGIVDVVNTVFLWLKKNVLDPLWRMLQEAGEAVSKALGSALEGIFKIVTTMVHPGSPLDPAAALPMLAVVAVAEMSLGMAIQTTNLIHPFKVVFGDQFQAMIYKFLGFNELSGAFWGSIGVELLDHPLRLWARMTFRARVPDHRLADEMYWHDELSAEEWHTLHTYEGWPDSTIAKHARSMWREPNVRELGMIMDVGGMSIDEISAVLRHRGTDPETAKVLAAAISRRPMADELRALRSELIKETAEGSMTVDELESALFAIGVTDAEFSLIKQIVAMRVARAQRLQADKDLKAYQVEAVKASTQAYERDLMDDGQYLEELLAAGVEPLKASQTLYLEQVKKVPRPKRVYELVSV